MIPIIPKSVQHGARHGRGRFYNDPEKVKYLNQIETESEGYIPDHPHLGPIRITFDFYLERPAWLNEAGIPENEPFPQWGYRGADWDNFCKGAQDGLAKCGFFHNDSQVFSGSATKWFSEETIGPRIEVKLEFYNLK